MGEIHKHGVKYGKREFHELFKYQCCVNTFKSIKGMLGELGGED